MNFEFLKGNEAKDQYQNIDFHRRGGMGEIYIGVDSDSGEKKAIKIIPIQSEAEYELLKSEFDISLNLKHKNIVPTEYYNEVEKKGIRYLYSVMSFNEKGSLRDYLSAQSESITLPELLAKMLDLAKGLEYAHSSIIHRDIKPENVLLGDLNELMLCDFGLAKLIDAKTRTKSYKGSGTLPYMSPECWVFETNTIAMDIYSLGILFYEIATLKLPFEGKNENEIRDHHLYSTLPNFSDVRVDLPIKLQEMIFKMTSKRPLDRYSNMTEIVQILSDMQSNIKDITIDQKDELLEKANKKISEIEQKKLEEQKTQQIIDSMEKFIDFSISGLFDQLCDRIEEINNGLERDNIVTNRGQNQLTVSFLGNSLSVKFYPRDDIESVIKSGREAVIQSQIEQYGMVLQAPKDSYLQQDNVILIGQMCMDDGGYGRSSWGYNLLLRKANEEDLYGQWWVVWFNDSPLLPKSPLDEHYAIEVPNFYEEYHHGRSNAIHTKTMGMDTLDHEGFDKILSKLIEG